MRRKKQIHVPEVTSCGFSESLWARSSALRPTVKLAKLANSRSLVHVDSPS